MAVVGDQFGPGWQRWPSSPRGQAVPATRAFGWGLTVPVDSAGGFVVGIRFDDQWKRTLEMGGLAVLWVLGLWITRKPARRPQ